MCLRNWLIPNLACSCTMTTKLWLGSPRRWMCLMTPTLTPLLPNLNLLAWWSHSNVSIAKSWRQDLLPVWCLMWTGSVQPKHGLPAFPSGSVQEDYASQTITGWPNRVWPCSGRVRFGNILQNDKLADHFRVFLANELLSCWDSHFQIRVMSDWDIFSLSAGLCDAS